MKMEAYMYEFSREVCDLALAIMQWRSRMTQEQEAYFWRLADRMCDDEIFRRRVSADFDRVRDLFWSEEFDELERWINVSLH
jgi:hypothetical protein